MDLGTGFDLVPIRRDAELGPLVPEGGDLTDKHNDLTAPAPRASSAGVIGIRACVSFQDPQDAHSAQCCPPLYVLTKSRG